MKKMIVRISALCLLLGSLVGCGPKPEELALQLAEAVNEQDLDGALALFAEDAIVSSVSPEPFYGKAEIQGWLEGMFADDFKLEAEIESSDGNLVYEKDTLSMDSMSFYGIDTLTGNSQITVDGGKIQAIKFSFSDETLADLQSAPFVAPEDLIGIWTVGTFIQFNEDGTFRMASRLDDLDLPVSEDHPGSLENWSYDGMVMTVRAVETAGESSSCTPDQVGTYYVRWAGENRDRLKFEPMEDPCGARNGGMQWGNWAAVAP